MGRPPTPSNVRAFTGNRGKRPLNKQEPDPEYLQDLEPPEWMPESAKVVWRENAKRLADAKLLTVADVEAFSMACVALAQYRLAVSRCGDNLVKAKYQDMDGEVVPVGEHINPWAMVQSMTFKQVMALLQQFGMTPAARSRVAINPQGSLFGGEGSADKTGAGRFFG